MNNPLSIKKQLLSASHKLASITVFSMLKETSALMLPKNSWSKFQSKFI